MSISIQRIGNVTHYKLENGELTTDFWEYHDQAPLPNKNNIKNTDSKPIYEHEFSLLNGKCTTDFWIYHDDVAKLMKIAIKAEKMALSLSGKPLVEHDVDVKNKSISKIIKLINASSKLKKNLSIICSKKGYVAIQKICEIYKIEISKKNN